MIYFKASTPYPLIAVPFCLLTNQSMSVTERYYCVFDVLLDCHPPPKDTHTHTHPQLSHLRGCCPLGCVVSRSVYPGPAASKASIAGDIINS